MYSPCPTGSTKKPASQSRPGARRRRSWRSPKTRRSVSSSPTKGTLSSDRRRSFADPDVGDERQMVRRHERATRARDLDADDVEKAGVVDVVEVKDREQSRVRASPQQ